MGIDTCMCDWVERNHREQKKRERALRKRRANKQQNIKDKLINFLFVVMICIIVGVAATADSIVDKLTTQNNTKHLTSETQIYYNADNLLK